MRIKAALYNADHLEYGLVTIPFPIPQDQYNDTIKMLEALDIGDPRAKDCMVEEIEGCVPSLKCLEGHRINVDELDYLVKRLDGFSDGELVQFQGMAAKMGLSDMTDLINLTFCCQQATVITDFSDLEQIGRDHYMNLHGGCVSTEELEELDSMETALLLISENEGTVTPYRNTTGFRYETLTDDPAVKKAVDDILLDVAGEENPRRTCNYGLTEAGKQALRDAADPSKPHTYSWFVMTDCNTSEEHIHKDLTLDGAIQLYQDIDRPEKRLGVTKDSIATVDLVRFCDGEQQFFEDYRRLESFRDDPAISDAVETIRRKLEQTSHQEDITMGGM